MKGPSLVRLLIVIPACLCISASCSRASTPVPSPAVPVTPVAEATVVVAPTSVPAPVAVVPPPTPVRAGQELDIADTWQPLWEKLSKDGLAYEEVAYLFIRLGDQALQDPMGRKVQELYRGRFLPKPPTPPRPAEGPDEAGIPRPWYNGIVTDTNARRCRAFINTHAEAFQAAEEKYGVSPEIGAALLFIETRLGDYLGEHNAFITLASMSVSRSPDAIPDWLEKLPGVENRLDWVGEKMADKADWAYAELKALLVYSVANGIDPFEIPGSMYGAIGLCQFMPSNLPRFAVDGNGDGIIDLFNAADAIASLSNYLAKHGWKPELTIPEQVKILRRYNNLAIYANTILALAKKVEQVPGRPAVNRALPRLPENVTEDVAEEA